MGTTLPLFHSDENLNTRSLQYKIGKLTEVDRVTAYFKHAGIDPIMTMSLELFIREHWLVTN